MSWSRGVLVCDVPPPPLDIHHWLYKAGYEQGYRDALAASARPPLAAPKKESE